MITKLKTGEWQTSNFVIVKDKSFAEEIETELAFNLEDELFSNLDELNFLKTRILPKIFRLMLKLSSRDTSTLEIKIKDVRFFDDMYTVDDNYFVVPSSFNDLLQDLLSLAGCYDYESNIVEENIIQIKYSWDSAFTDVVNSSGNNISSIIKTMFNHAEKLVDEI